MRKLLFLLIILLSSCEEPKEVKEEKPKNAVFIELDVINIANQKSVIIQNIKVVNNYGEILNKTKYDTIIDAGFSYVSERHYKEVYDEDCDCIEEVYDKSTLEKQQNNYELFITVKE